ncbi:restriction endonuclease subunit S [Parasedimentitalea huanghaiensis]|nr:restriction endonuclease subunit S [Zongyanglinia huanghaiensis]
MLDITSGFAFSSKQFSETNGMPLIRIRDVTRGETKLKFDGAYDQRFVVNNDDLLVSMDGEFKLAEWKGGPALLNQRVCRVEPKDSRLDRRFLRHFLPKKLKEIEDRTPFVTVKHLSVKSIRAIEVPDINPSEQRRIAAILDKADAIRRKRERALTLADDFLKSTFLEMFGDPSENPKNYPVENFASILSIPLRNGISPSSRGTVLARVLTLSAITGDHFDEKQEKEGKFLVPISAKDTVNDSDFYICRGNGSPDLIGKGYYATQTIPGTAFPDTMIAAKPNPTKVTRAFLEGIWNSPFVRNQILEAARTTNGTFKINQTAAGAIKIPVPPMEAQKRFQTILDRVRQSNEKLKFGDDLFPSLSQRAFNGDL